MGRVARLTSRQTCAKFLKDSPPETGRRLVHEHLGLTSHRHHLQRAACQARSVGEDAGYYLAHGLDGALIRVLLVWLIASAIFTSGSAGSFTVMSGCQKCCYPRTVRQNRRSSRSTGTHPGYGVTSQSHAVSDRPAADLDQVPCSFFPGEGLWRAARGRFPAAPVVACSADCRRFHRCQILLSPGERRRTCDDPIIISDPGDDRCRRSRQLFRQAAKSNLRVAFGSRDSQIGRTCSVIDGMLPVIGAGSPVLTGWCQTVIFNAAAESALSASTTPFFRTPG